MNKKKILISCNMGIQHFYFTKAFIEKYQEKFEIKVLFQSHLEKQNKLTRAFNIIKKDGLLKLLRKIVCNNQYGKISQIQQKEIYQNFYGEVDLDFFMSTLGRGNVYISSDVNSKESIDLVKEFSPDIFLLQGGKLLKDDFIKTLHKSYILHLHLGIVPYYRGGNSQFWSIYNNAVNENGFTIQSVDLGIDTGAIYIRKSIIDFNHLDNHHTMYCKTQLAGIDAIKSLIDYYVENNYIPKPKNVSEKGFNYTGKMVTESAKEYVNLNTKRVMEQYSKSNKSIVFEDISVI